MTAVKQKIQRVWRSPAALQDKAASLQARLDQLQNASRLDNTEISAVMLALANADKQLQKYDQAETLYKSVVALDEKLENQTALTNALSDFANLYYVMGKYTDTDSLILGATSLSSRYVVSPLTPAPGRPMLT